MKKIYNWALEQCGANDGIINAVNMLRYEQAERFVEVVVGCEIKDEEIPREIIHEGKLHKFVRSNYILNEITYTCEDTSVRYFSNKEGADKYAEDGSYSWDGSSSSAKDNYPYKGEWTRECQHTTWYERWFEWSEESK